MKQRRWRSATMSAQSMALVAFFGRTPHFALHDARPTGAWPGTDHGRAGTHWLRVLTMGTLPALPLALPAHVASTDQTLWLSAGLFAALVLGAPRSAMGVKVLGVLAASAMCSLALVNTGQ